MMMHYVFVYGTLKRGFPNHNEKSLGHFYIDDAVTVKRYALVIANQHYVPVLLLDNDHHTKEAILGELYKVDKKMLAWLDTLEGVGKPKGYQRIKIAVKTKAEKIIMTNVYAKKRKNLDMIHTKLTTHYSLDPRYIIPELRQ